MAVTELLTGYRDRRAVRVRCAGVVRTHVTVVAFFLVAGAQPVDARVGDAALASTLDHKEEQQRFISVVAEKDAEIALLLKQTEVHEVERGVSAGKTVKLKTALKNLTPLY